MMKNKTLLTFIFFLIVMLSCQTQSSETNTLDKKQKTEKDTITVLREELPMPELLIENKKIDGLSDLSLPLNKKFSIEFYFPKDPLNLKGEFDLNVTSDELELKKIDQYKYTVKITKFPDNEKAKLKIYYVFPEYIIHVPNSVRSGAKFVDLYYDSTFAVGTEVFKVDSVSNFTTR